MTTADELRRVVLSLPEAEERETWGVPAHVGRHGWMSIQLARGHPTFRVRDKMLAALSDDGREASVKATRQEQAALVAAARSPSAAPPTWAATAG